MLQMHRSLGMVADGRCTILFECRLVQRTKSPNPSLRLQAIVEEILQAYIFPRADSAHKQYQNWAYRNMYRNSYQRDSCMMGLGSARRRSWGSLTTHLQGWLPSCKGEQSLTFKETRPRRQYCCLDRKGPGPHTCLMTILTPSN